MSTDKSGKFKFKMVEGEEFAETSIDLLALSNRATNALKSNKLYTIGNVVDHWRDLPMMPRIGKTVAQEVRASVFSAYINDIWDNDRKLETLGASLEAV